MLDGTPTVPGDLVSVVVPGGLTEGKAIKIAFDAAVEPSATMLLVPGEAIGVEKIAPRGDAYVLALGDFLPAQNWVPIKTGSTAGTDWLASGNDKIEISVEKVERTRQAIVSTGPRSFEDIFGAPPAELNARPVEDGETFDPQNTLMVMPGDNVSANWPESAGARPEAFDFGDAAPRPAPLGGVSFSVAVVSTPNAKVVGNSTNPLSHIDTDELLQRDVVQNLLAEAGCGEGTDFQIEAGPERVTPDGGPETTTLLGHEGEIESYIGVLGSSAAGWGVGLHVVRADGDDHVIVVGLHRHPLGEPAQAMETLRESSALVEARKLVAETAAQLQ